MPLDAVDVKSVEAGIKSRKVTDGKGLYLFVTPQGSKLWRFDYRFSGKRYTLAFGRWPDVTLKQARTRRERARKCIAMGRDPRVTREAVTHSFENTARAWYAANQLAWTPRYAKLVLGRLEADIFPHIGQEDIGKIEPPRLLEVIRKIEARGAVEMAKRIKGHCSEIFQYGIAEGKCDRDPANDIRRALMKSRPKQHRHALPPSEFPDLVKKFRAYDGDEITKLALQFTLLTMVRTQETRFAKWNEFERLDSDEPLWRLSSERMKMNREHLVPIARQTVAILRRLKELNPDSQHPFTADTRTSVISENTMLFALYRMGYHGRQTTHGLRRCASTILNESGEFPPDWIEVQLAHADRNRTRVAYNAAIYLPHRRKMLQWWADFIDSQTVASLSPWST
jgi:integrase